ncbi:uncharacterized protein isoform X2 [Danio rerio]
MVTLRVRPQQNVTLVCALNCSSSMRWLRVSSERISVLISARRSKLPHQGWVTERNEDAGRLALQPDSELRCLHLQVTALQDEDLGLYFCSADAAAGGDMRFGDPVRLTFTDSDSVGCETLCYSACAACGIFMIICTAAVLMYKCCTGSSADSCISCVKDNPNMQAAQVQYSSLRFIRRSRTPAAPPDNVTYATIAKHTP